MATQSVGIREFRDKLATYLLESDGPLAITRHGDTTAIICLQNANAQRPRRKLSKRPARECRR
jgi:PHD/YefM family antitoxin component YafN of YafNO toxin-antitoxin module